MDDLVAVSTLLKPGETNYVGWRVGTDERLNAWRSESPGNLHLHFRAEQFEQTLDAGARGAVQREPMTDEQYEMALAALAAVGVLAATEEVVTGATDDTYAGLIDWISRGMPGAPPVPLP